MSKGIAETLMAWSEAILAMPDTTFEHAALLNGGCITDDLVAAATRISNLETALLAATDLAKRQCARIEELEAERDARPVVRWEEHQHHKPLYVGPMCIGCVFKDDRDGTWYWDNNEERFLTPEAAKAAVEEALRGLSAKTEGA